MTEYRFSTLISHNAITAYRFIPSEQESKDSRETKKNEIKWIRETRAKWMRAKAWARWHIIKKKGRPLFIIFSLSLFCFLVYFISLLPNDVLEETILLYYVRAINTNGSLKAHGYICTKLNLIINVKESGKQIRDWTNNQENEEKISFSLPLLCLLLLNTCKCEIVVCKDLKRKRKKNYLNWMISNRWWNSREKKLSEQPESKIIGKGGWCAKMSR